MARKTKSARKGGDHFDAGNGHVLNTERSVLSGAVSIKAEIERVREIVPNRSKDDVALILQSFDYNVESAVSCFTSGDADSILSQWNTQGRKNGSANKKKKKKKAIENDSRGPREDDLSAESSERKSSPVAAVAMAPELKLETKPDIFQLHLEPTSKNTNSTGQTLPPPPSPPKSDSTASTPKSPSSTESSKEKPPSENVGHRTKIERLPSFSGPDVLKKTVKDLQRSSVTLPRLQLLLEEECDRSTAAIKTVFQGLHRCLNERESTLATQMETFKRESVDLLQQRQENAAALKLKVERVGGMDEAHVTSLRNEIRNFVSERRFDEELANTCRFVCDEAKLNKEIELFGEVLPIKNSYKPVELNPSPPSKPAKQTSEAQANTAAPVVPSPPSLDAESDLGSSELPDLHERAEMHARLQASLKLQGISLDAVRQSKRRGEDTQQTTKEQKSGGGNTGKPARPKKENKQEKGAEGGRQTSPGKRGARGPGKEKREENSERHPEQGGKDDELRQPRSPRKRNAQSRKEEAQKGGGHSAGAGVQGGVQLEKEPQVGESEERRPKQGSKDDELRQPRSPRKRNAQSRNEEAQKEGGHSAGAGVQGGIQLENEPQVGENKESGKEKPARGRRPRSPRKGNAKGKKDGVRNEDGADQREEGKVQSSDGQGRKPEEGVAQTPVHPPEEPAEQRGEKTEAKRRPKRRGGKKKRANGDEESKREGVGEGGAAKTPDEDGTREDGDATQQRAAAPAKKRRPRKRAQDKNKRDATTAGDAVGSEGLAAKEGEEGGTPTCGEAEQGEDEGSGERAPGRVGEEEREGEARQDGSGGSEVEEATTNGDGELGDEQGAGASAAGRANEVDGMEDEGVETQRESGRPDVVGVEKDETMLRPGQGDGEIETNGTEDEGEETQQEPGRPDVVAAEDDETMLRPGQGDGMAETNGMEEGRSEPPEERGPAGGVERASTVEEETAKETTSDGVNGRVVEPEGEKWAKTPTDGEENPTVTPNGEAKHAADQALPTEALPQRQPRAPRRRNLPARDQGTSLNNEHSVDNGIASHGPKAPHTRGFSEGDTKASPVPAPVQDAPEGEEAVEDDGKAGSVTPVAHLNGLVQVNGNAADECLVER